MRTTDRKVKIECTDKGRHEARPVAELWWTILGPGETPPCQGRDEDGWSIAVVAARTGSPHPYSFEHGTVTLDCPSCTRRPVLSWATVERIASYVRRGDTRALTADMSRDGVTFR